MPLGLRIQTIKWRIIHQEHRGETVTSIGICQSERKPVFNTKKQMSSHALKNTSTHMLTDYIETRT
uniref:Uncharacterized protein n=1 Tax=Rhizophora mucronata TaxID=61149 RepID=A0A2P2PYY0_RHIMU